jgi:hypothetical protein
MGLAQVLFRGTFMLVRMNRVSHFEIHADNPERAIDFYQTLFGWTFNRWKGPMPYWLITTGPADVPGIDGGLLPREGPGPLGGQAVNAYVCTVLVAQLDAMIAKALAGGAALAVPKMAVPGIGWLAYIKDTEGNLLGMMQSDVKAS